MFSGSFAHSVDSKGRIVIPAKFRGKLGETFVVTKGLNGCLWIFPEKVWPSFLKKCTPKSILNSRNLALERYFIGAATECAADVQGRVQIPQILLNHAGIRDEIYIVGLTDRLEIWAKDKWDSFNAELTDEMIRQLGDEIESE